MNLGDIKRIHFVGIGGIGMSGIAEILLSHDIRISGCDAKATQITERLKAEGIEIAIGHDASHVSGADLVVVSSAIRPDNPEVIAARAQGIEVIRRAEMLGRIVAEKTSVGIAGTHGKTTTSAMTSVVLSEAGLDPTMIVGGVVRNVESNAKVGASDYLVVEADEYDRSFLALDPTHIVITNIEADHLDCYRDLDDIRGAFETFASKVKHGVVVGCADDANVRELLAKIEARALSYGLSESANLRATDLDYRPDGTSFRVAFEHEILGPVDLQVPGDHNVRNALAAIAIGIELGIPFDTIATALSRYRGVERRFQLLGEKDGVLIVDDYAHHPTEIRATLEAARKTYPDRRLVALFQPHLYSRTRDFSADFAEALSLADVALVAPIYPAREEPIDGVSSDLITDAATRSGSKHVQPFGATGSEAVTRMRAQLRPGDLFVTMGAGDINEVGVVIAGGKA